ncbi:thioredoxin family protein [Carboxylicivirga sp. A043]|uniref:thioredoxin family protein n=1 Tax=Carboxylicivirga litoralis TaxID=2816963 RepID=UPI0021CB64AD|nr:thioredoxin family protein [Carboxylicivirga sp. A043]MCU4157929.1 thioredoxin family protein [Carboxylicivirga sp. A043]
MRKYVLLLAIVVSVFSLHAQVKVGDKAPDFKLINTDYQKVALSDFSDQEGVILIFTCNHCPYAKFYEERINLLHKAYEPQKFPVVAINPNDSVKYATDGFSHMVAKQYQFPYLLDNEGVYKAYGATKTPHVFLLDNTRNGFEVAYIGAIDDSPQEASQVKVKYLEDAIKAVKEGKKVNPDFTKAIGCSIKPFQ